MSQRFCRCLRYYRLKCGHDEPIAASKCIAQQIGDANQRRNGGRTKRLGFGGQEVDGADEWGANKLMVRLAVEMPGDFLTKIRDPGRLVFQCISSDDLYVENSWL